MENGVQALGLLALWQQSDVVIKLVALVLLLMSVASWVVIILKLMDQARLRGMSKRIQQFWDSPDYDVGIQTLDDGRRFNLFRSLALQSREALSHLQQGDSQPHLRESLDTDAWVGRAIQNAIDDGAARLQSGLAILASVGSTAPFVGLLGTVWGIYHALVKIGATGQSSLDQVAGPIGEALIMTAFGLAVAIPAVLGYNALLRGNKTVLQQLKRFARDIHALHLTGARMRHVSAEPTSRRKA
jgi:biopolymer transport protein ExbB